MKFIVEIHIKRSINKVVTHFECHDFRLCRERGLTNIRHLSGLPGQDGARYLLHYENGSKALTIEEKILANRLPEEFIAHYSTPGIDYTVSSKFIAVAEFETIWVMEMDFTFSGFQSFLSIFMRPSLKKRSQAIMNHFKQFIEKEAGS